MSSERRYLFEILKQVTAIRQLLAKKKRRKKK